MKALFIAALTVLLTGTVLTVRSQDNSARLTGNVKDDAGQPVIAATVVLRKAQDSSVVKAALSDTSGAYVFEQIPYGNYFIHISSIGYQSATLRPVTVNSAALQLPEGILGSHAKSLKGVTVTGKRPLIEQYADRTVVNAEGVVSAAGGSAMDVLEKSPGVAVDKQGNITIRGKQGVKVFIDGRATYVNGADLAGILRNMQASQIDQVEIISNPSAKYDAAGNGVINIRTKKTNVSGFNGSVAVAYIQGRYPGTTQNINFNYRSGKFNLFGNGGYSYRKGFEDIYILRNFRKGPDGNIQTIYDQNSFTRSTNQSLNGKLGLDFYASDRTTLGVAVSGFHNPARSNTDNNTLLKSPDGKVQTQVIAPADMDGKWDNSEVDLSFKHRFDSSEHELSIDASYLQYNTTSVQHFNNNYFDAAGNPQEPARIFMADMPGNIKIYTAKADYGVPLGYKGKLELGAKYSYVNTDNNAAYFDQKGGSWIPNDSLSNHFLYKEYVYAGYINYKKTIGDIELQAGIRAEQMQMKGHQLNGNASFDRSYLQWFPSAMIAYSLDPQNKLSLSYSRRIERPDYRSLNPFRFYLDQYTYEEGNPYLLPQYSHNVELSHIFMDGALTTTLLYNKTNDVIQEVVQQRSATNETFIRPENISTRRIAGINTNLQLPLGDNLTTIAYLEFNNYKYSGIINSEPYSLSANTFSAQLRQQVKLSAVWMVELAGLYTSRAIDGTFIQRPVGTFSLGLQRELFNRKATLRLNAVDLFRWYKYEATSRYQNVDVYALNRWQTQNLRLIFTYRFRSGMKLAERAADSASPEKERVKIKEK
ncbi:TonB-dependent receptor domain-containing protein [Chitinophaga vietnamensis]|uniref:TonB-dependent receptor domain-containing protein n=1 Tax=Chitinophaga vietnamensis TaxID=2593957 RepID=UPI0011789E57|nr:TonB-dependent receptor [Chitinophaga vietnamensis]